MRLTKPTTERYAHVRKKSLQEDQSPQGNVVAHNKMKTNKLSKDKESINRGQ